MYVQPISCIVFHSTAPIVFSYAQWHLRTKRPNIARCSSTTYYTILPNPYRCREWCAPSGLEQHHTTERNSCDGDITIDILSTSVTINSTSTYFFSSQNLYETYILVNWEFMTCFVSHKKKSIVSFGWITESCNLRRRWKMSFSF